MEKAQKLLEQLQQHGGEVLGKVKDFIREVIEIIFPSGKRNVAEPQWDAIKELIKQKIEMIVAKLKELAAKGNEVIMPFTTSTPFLSEVLSLCLRSWFNVIPVSLKFR